LDRDKTQKGEKLVGLQVLIVKDHLGTQKGSFFLGKIPITFSLEDKFPLGRPKATFFGAPRFPPCCARGKKKPRPKEGPDFLSKGEKHPF